MTAAVVGEASRPTPPSDAARRTGWIVLLICTLLAMVEGFDGQIVSLAAPQMATAFGVAASSFGPVFAGGMAGAMLGVFVQNIVGDRLGRRTVVLLSYAMMGVASLLIPLERSLPLLVALRFLIGVGIGAAMPNLFSITSEYAPVARRFLFVTIVFTGIALGAVVGGIASAAILASAGWATLFVLSGTTTLAFCLVVHLALPESLSFLRRRPGRRDELERLLARTGAMTEPVSLGSTTVSEARPSIRSLFAEGRAAGTVDLWLISFSSLLVSIALAAWLPTILTRSGLTLASAVLITTVLNGGGMVGSLAQSALVDRQGFRPMILGYLIGAASLAAAALPLGPTALAAAIFVHGISFIGAQMCLASLATYYYPPDLRSVGVGWAMGMGRVGGIIGTLLGGVLLAHDFSARAVFLGCGVVIAALALLLGRADRSRRASR